MTGAALHKSEGLQSFAEFREELASPTWDELELAAELKGVLPNGHEKSIASTLIRSIGRLGPEGWDFLRLASMLAVTSIPASLISAVFSKVDGLDESEGRRRALLGLDQAENLAPGLSIPSYPGPCDIVIPGRNVQISWKLLHFRH
ncbi:MAG: hypothetical protein ACT6FG_03285 [Methanosarcinaceae archaeon]